MVTIFCPLRADGARARTATPRTNAFEAMCVLIVLCMIHSFSKEYKIVTKWVDLVVASRIISMPYPIHCPMGLTNVKVIYRSK